MSTFTHSIYILLPMLHALSNQWIYIQNKIVDQIILGCLSLIQMYDNEEEIA